MIQRWHFAGGTHNAKLWHRRPGAIGSGSKVIKGKKMAGQLGGTYENIRGLQVSPIK